MRIISYDKEINIDFDTAELVVSRATKDRSNNDFLILANGTIFGVYASKDEAIKVLDMCNEYYLKHGSGPSSFLFPLYIDKKLGPQYRE